MAKTFVQCSTTAELSSVFISEFNDGAFAYVVANTTHYALKKTAVGAPGVGEIFPVPGAPLAGYATQTARWVALTF